MKKLFIILTSLFITVSLYAQVIVSNYSNPNLATGGLFGKSEKINELKIDSLKKINYLNNSEFKFAEQVPVDISPLTQASKEIIDNDIILRQKIIAQKATSIKISFDTLFLSKNASLYIYNLQGSIITGPITSKENIQKGRLWSSNTFNDSIIILELKMPKSEEGQNSLHISKILSGLQDRINLNPSDSTGIGHFNSSSPCNINVICSQGNPWVNERKAICLIETDDGSSCSGALLTNTCNTNNPYVLTAWHCTNGKNPNNWTYSFGWWSTTCTPNTNNQQYLLFNGATLRATYEPTDFSLLELFQTPSSTSGLTYLGWSRSSATPSTSVGIHHPMDDQMKISFANNPATIGNIRLNTNTAWRVLWNSGTTEKGSSGSPLFNQNHQVVGQNFSETQPTYPPCNQQTGGNNYGRFDLSWTGGGTNATRLSNWLDASNSGAITTNTTNVSNLINAKPALSISGNDPLCYSASYTLNGATTGTITWSSSNTSIATVTGQGSTATVTKVGDGSVFITATVTFCPGTTASVSKQITVGAATNYYIQSMSMNSPNRLDIYPSFTGSQLVVTSWYVYVDGSFSTSGSGYPPSVISVYASCGSHNVTLTTSNSCGSYSTSSYYSGSGCFALTPNPAGSNVTVTDMSANNKSSSSGGKTLASIGRKVTITVFDNASRPLKQFNFSRSNQYNFSVGDLTPGTYIIQIKQNGLIDNLKLIKQ